MFRKWLSRYPNEQIPPFLAFIVLAFTLLATAAPASVAIWLANGAWSTKILSIVFLLFFSIPTFLVLYLYFRQMSYKEMTYRVTSQTPLVATNVSQVTPSLLTGLHVTFNEKPQTSVYLVFVEFRNTGNKAITKADYKVNGIPLKFDPPAVILGASIKGRDTSLVPDEPDRKSIMLPYLESEPNKLISISLFLETVIDKVIIEGEENYNFVVRRGYDTQSIQKAQNHIWRIFNAMTICLFITSSLAALGVVLFTFSANNILFLSLLLGGITLTYLSIMFSKLFNFLFLSKQPKI